MERFVRLLVAGGASLVAGLWATSLSPGGSVPWAAGVVLAVAGVCALAGGVWWPVDY